MVAIVILQVVQAVLILYLVILLISILSTWIAVYNRPHFLGVLDKISKPYLDLFRKIKGLQIGKMNFNVILGVILLQLLITYLARIHYRLQLAEMVGSAVSVFWIGNLIGAILQTLGGALQSIAGFFAILCLIRLIAIFAKASMINPAWQALDAILQPLVYPIVAKFSPNRVIPYGTGLIIATALFAAIWFASGLLFGWLAALSLNILF